MKKAQTSTEYLVILAVVIVLALIVVGVLGGFSNIGGGASDRSNRLYWQQTDIGILNHAFSASDEDTYVKIQNNLGQDITLQEFTLDGTSIYSGSLPLSAGDTFEFKSGTMTGSGKTCTSGGDFSFKVMFNYTLETAAVYSFDGDGTELQGTCSTVDADDG